MTQPPVQPGSGAGGATCDDTTPTNYEYPCDGYDDDCDGYDSYDCGPGYFCCGTYCVCDMCGCV